jgi:hypothetical protein
LTFVNISSILHMTRSVRILKKKCHNVALCFPDRGHPSGKDGLRPIL